MKYFAAWLLLLIFDLGLAVQEADTSETLSEGTQTYVSSQLWKGVLVLQNTYDIDAKIEESLEQIAGEKQLKTCCITAADSPQIPLLTKLFSDSKQHAQLDATQIFRIDNTQALDSLATYQRIWLEVDEATLATISMLAPQQRKKLISSLQAVLIKGGLVCIAGKLDWIGTQNDEDEGLLRNCVVTTSSTTENTDLVQLSVPEGSRLTISRRQVICTSDTPGEITLLPTEHYPESLVYPLKSGEIRDWTQIQRTRLERQQPSFPAATNYRHALSGGALVIGGGGGMPMEVWNRFVDLAGGENSRIIILPTAVPEPKATPGLEHRLLTKAGAGTIVTLPQTSREEVSSGEFLRELDHATGVWFGGGRQWHFVDAYWGTPALEKLRDVCKRGGVIGGSSAGATIQGDILIRGAPAGNHILLADGYRHGLALLPGVAIDQHFSQRNRFEDFENFLTGFPTVFGIGIDEQTALIVQSTNQCEVMGNSSVWCYPSQLAGRENNELGSRSTGRVEHKSGSRFLLDAP